MFDNIWINYEVEWRFLNSVCGSVPGDPKLIEAWIDARKPKVKPPGGRPIEEIHQEIFSTLEAEASGEDEPPVNMLVFQRVDGRLVERASTIKAHIKDCARQVSSLYVGKVEGEKSFAVRILNGLYQDPLQYWIPLLHQDGVPFSDADGNREKPIHVRGPRGEPINAIKVFEFINEPIMRFTLKVLGAKQKGARAAVSIEDIQTLFEYGGVHGYAGERGDGEGRYIATVSLKEKELEKSKPAVAVA